MRQTLKIAGLIVASILTFVAYLISDYFDRITTIMTYTAIACTCGCISYFIHYIWVKMMFVAVFFTLPTLAFGTYGHIINETTCSKSKIRKTAIACYSVFFGLAGIALSLIFYGIKSADNGF